MGGGGGAEKAPGWEKVRDPPADERHEDEAERDRDPARAKPEPRERRPAEERERLGEPRRAAGGLELGDLDARVHRLAERFRELARVRDMVLEEPARELVVLGDRHVRVAREIVVSQAAQPGAQGGAA